MTRLTTITQEADQLINNIEMGLLTKTEAVKQVEALASSIQYNFENESDDFFRALDYYYDACYSIEETFTDMYVK